MTVGMPCSYGVAWVRQARNEMPSTSAPSRMLMIDRVRRALRPAGGLNALTPLEIASRPVRDDPPLANARSR